MERKYLVEIIKKSILDILDKEIEGFKQRKGDYPNLIIVNPEVEKKIYAQLKEGIPEINNCWIDKEPKNYRGILLKSNIEIKFIDLTWIYKKCYTDNKGKMKLLIETLGIIGTLFTLSAYFGLERKKLTSKGILYPILNGISGMLLLSVGIYNKSISIIIINIFWILISISLLIKNLRRKWWNIFSGDCLRY